MKKTIFLVISFLLTCGWLSSCKDTQTYADLVRLEREAIDTWISSNPYTEFGRVSSWDDEKLTDITKDILNDSIHPCKYLELNKWYHINEGDFKRLYFRINDWGNDGVTNYDDEAQLEQAMRNRKKFYGKRDVLLRYDSLFIINDFNYEDLDKNIKGDNLDPNSFLICYNWNTSYYCNMYYGSSYGSGSSYECTSGGLGFPIRFLWEGGNASIICPFSLVESSFASSYYTLYYGNITYSRPNYLPK